MSVSTRSPAWRTRKVGMAEMALVRGAEGRVGVGSIGQRDACRDGLRALLRPPTRASERGSARGARLDVRGGEVRGTQLLCGDRLLVIDVDPEEDVAGVLGGELGVDGGDGLAGGGCRCKGRGRGRAGREGRGRVREHRTRAVRPIRSDRGRKAEARDGREEGGQLDDDHEKREARRPAGRPSTDLARPAPGRMEVDDDRLALGLGRAEGRVPLGDAGDLDGGHPAAAAATKGWCGVRGSGGRRSWSLLLLLLCGRRRRPGGRTEREPTDRPTPRTTHASPLLSLSDRQDPHARVSAYAGAGMGRRVGEEEASVFHPSHREGGGGYRGSGRERESRSSETCGNGREGGKEGGGGAGGAHEPTIPAGSLASEPQQDRERERENERARRPFEGGRLPCQSSHSLEPLALAVHVVPAEVAVEPVALEREEGAEAERERADEPAVGGGRRAERPGALLVNLEADEAEQGEVD